jgi:hypothetical protein
MVSARKNSPPISASLAAISGSRTSPALNRDRLTFFAGRGWQISLGEVLAPPGGRPGGSRQTDGGWEPPAWIMLVATMIDHGLEASATCVMLEKERP